MAPAPFSSLLILATIFGVSSVVFSRTIIDDSNERRPTVTSQEILELRKNLHRHIRPLYTQKTPKPVEKHVTPYFVKILKRRPPSILHPADPKVLIDKRRNKQPEVKFIKAYENLGVTTTPIFRTTENEDVDDVSTSTQLSARAFQLSKSYPEVTTEMPLSQERQVEGTTKSTLQPTSHLVPLQQELPSTAPVPSKMFSDAEIELPLTEAMPALTEESNFLAMTENPEFDASPSTSSEMSRVAESTTGRWPEIVSTTAISSPDPRELKSSAVSLPLTSTMMPVDAETMETASSSIRPVVTLFPELATTAIAETDGSGRSESSTFGFSDTVSSVTNTEPELETTSSATTSTEQPTLSSTMTTVGTTERPQEPSTTPSYVPDSTTTDIVEKIPTTEVLSTSPQSTKTIKLITTTTDPQSTTPTKTPTTSKSAKTDEPRQLITDPNLFSTSPDLTTAILQQLSTNLQAELQPLTNFLTTSYDQQGLSPLLGEATGISRSDDSTTVARVDPLQTAASEQSPKSTPSIQATIAKILETDPSPSTSTTTTPAIMLALQNLLRVQQQAQAASEFLPPVYTTPTTTTPRPSIFRSNNNGNNNSNNNGLLGLIMGPAEMLMGMFRGVAQFGQMLGNTLTNISRAISGQSV